MKTINELSEKFSETKIIIDYSDGVQSVSLKYRGVDLDGDPISKKENLVGSDVSEEDQVLLMSILERSRIRMNERVTSENP